MNNFKKKIHYVLWIDRHIYFKGIYYPKQYTIEEYGTYKNKFKDMKTFKNKCELKIYLAIKGIKFDKFKIYDNYSYASMISFYDE